jgi:hypothetical protein
VVFSWQSGLQLIISAINEGKASQERTSTLDKQNRLDYINCSPEMPDYSARVLSAKRIHFPKKRTEFVLGAGELKHQRARNLGVSVKKFTPFYSNESI